MARNLDAKCRQCRREGEEALPERRKCFTDKCAIERRNYPPGQHGQKNSRLSGYGVQLREKQKLRRIYGVLERQFRRYYHRATAEQGLTGEALLQMLEVAARQRRLRMGFGASRAEARQIVRHNGILVNGKRVNIPSYQCRPGDVVEVAQGAKEQLRIKAALEAAGARLSRVGRSRRRALKGTFKALPAALRLPSTINESLVVELYSK